MMKCLKYIIRYENCLLLRRGTCLEQEENCTRQAWRKLSDHHWFVDAYVGNLVDDISPPRHRDSWRVRGLLWLYSDDG